MALFEQLQGYKMKNFDLSQAPLNFFVWRIPKEYLSTAQKLTVPLGFEIIARREGEFSDIYRPGDSLIVGERGGLFRQSHQKTEDVYLCKKEMSKPLIWGLGDMPRSDSCASGLFGACGQMRLSVSNARLLVQKLCAGINILEEKEFSRQLEIIIVQGIRPAMMASVEKLTFDEALRQLDHLADETSALLKPSLFQVGLQLDTLMIENLFCA